MKLFFERALIPRPVSSHGGIAAPITGPFVECDTNTHGALVGPSDPQRCLGRLLPVGQEHFLNEAARDERGARLLGVDVARAAPQQPHSCVPRPRVRGVPAAPARAGRAPGEEAV